MKNVALLLFVIFTAFLNTATAQSPSTTPPGAIAQYFKVDTKTVVKDSSGKVYPFAEWTKAMKTGEYTLMPENINSAATAFILSKRRVQQRGSLSQNQANYAATATPAVPVKFLRPDESSIVKDSSGMIYPYLIWNKMVMSGNYNLRQINHKPDSVTYVLIRKTPAEKDEMMARIPKPEESKQFKSGDLFRPFKEKDIRGEKIDLPKMPGKVIVLNFWFIGCPPCRAEIPDLSAMADRYKNNPDVIFIAVALDQAYELKDFLKDHPLSYHVTDNGQYLASKYGVHLYPTNVVIDRDSRVAYSSEGGHPNNVYWIEKTINAALAGAQKTTATQ